MAFEPEFEEDAAGLEDEAVDGEEAAGTEAVVEDMGDAAAQARAEAADGAGDASPRPPRGSHLKLVK